MIDRDLLRRCVTELERHAERLTEAMQVTYFRDDRRRKEVAERRAECWRASRILERLIDKP